MFFSKFRKQKHSNVDEGNTIGAILLQMKVVTPSQMEEATAHKAVHDDMMLVSMLRSLGFVTADNVSTALKIQSKMIEGDRASVALDLMEARIDKFRAGEEQLGRELERRKAMSKDGCLIIQLRPTGVKAS